MKIDSIFHKTFQLLWESIIATETLEKQMINLRFLKCLMNTCEFFPWKKTRFLTSVARLWLAPLSSRNLTTSRWFSWAAIYKGVKPFCERRSQMLVICSKKRLHTIIAVILWYKIVIFIRKPMLHSEANFISIIIIVHSP